VLPLTAGLGLMLITARYDGAGLLGLRQASERGQPPTPDRLLILGPYRYLRHPLMACLLGFLWTQPVLTPTLALLNGGLTIYIGVGVVLEERDLVSRFGASYRAYRRRVFALLPWRPVAAAVHESVLP